MIFPDDLVLKIEDSEKSCCFAVKNSLKLYGEIYLARNLPPRVFSISLESVFALLPVTKICSFESAKRRANFSQPSIF